MPITRILPFILKIFAMPNFRFILSGLGQIIGLVGLVLGVVELLERVLGNAFVFISVAQRDGGHAWMPVSAIDQFVEFG